MNIKMVLLFLASMVITTLILMAGSGRFGDGGGTIMMCILVSLGTLGMAKLMLS